MQFAIRRLFAADGNIRAALQGPTDVATFQTHEEAEAERHRLEQEHRASSPFKTWPQASVYDLSSLEPAILCDWMQDGGIEPPAPDADGRRDWAAWWTSSAHGWSREQQAHVWRGLDRARHFEVAQRQLLRPLFLVVERTWGAGEGPNWSASSYEMAVPRQAFQCRDSAERRAAELRGRPPRPRPAGSLHAWENAHGETARGTFATAPLYEVRAIEQEGQGPLAWAPMRTAICLDHHVHLEEGVARAWVPLRAFSGPEEASSFLNAATEMARKSVSPLPGVMESGRLCDADVYWAARGLGLPEPEQCPNPRRQEFNLEPWWRAVVTELTAEQRQELFSRLHVPLFSGVRLPIN